MRWLAKERFRVEMKTSEQSTASMLDEVESGSPERVLQNLAMEIAKHELKEASIVLNEWQEIRLAVHIASLVSRRQNKELFPEMEEVLMNEVSLWGWEVAKKTTLHLNLPEWKVSKAEQFLLAIHFESAKLESSLIKP